MTSPERRLPRSPSSPFLVVTVLALACASPAPRGGAGGSGGPGSGDRDSGSGNNPNGGAGGASGGGAAAGNGTGGGGPGSGSGGVGGGPSAGDGSINCASDDLNACACSSAGATRDCWSGPGMPGVGPCKKGTQTCQGQTVLSWGPCTGETRPTTEMCGDKVDNDCNGAMDCADPACEEVCRPACECKSGASRWCHVPGIECQWGQQVCLPDATWGACLRTPARPPGCSEAFYDVCCCIAGGQCCEVDDNHDKEHTGHGISAGACGAATCGPATPKVAHGCPGQGRCMPGKQRLCQVNRSSEWGAQACLPDGSWGTCVRGNVAPPDCDAREYGSLCCARAGKCCMVVSTAKDFGLLSCGEYSAGDCTDIACQ